MAVYVTPYVDIVVATSIYTVGDALGPKNSFANIPEHGVIMSFMVIDRDKEDDAVDMFLFHRETVGTPDLDPFSPTDEELSTCVGRVQVAAGDYTNLSNNSYAVVDNIGLPYWAPSRTLFFQCRTPATPTYTAATDVLVAIGIVHGH